MDVTYDASPVVGTLYQGAFPQPGPWLEGRVQTLVLCAKELQPPAGVYPGVRVIHAPFDDAGKPPKRKEIQTAFRAARAVRARLDAGDRVLVTCHMGLNRSGLVTALALMLPRGFARRQWFYATTPDCLSNQQAIRLVRRARGPNALSNPWFESLVLGFNGMCRGRPAVFDVGSLLPL